MLDKQPQQGSKLGVSILICTYNGAERLVPTLAAIIGQKDTDGIPWEVVLVDNASTDNTAQIAEEAFQGSSIKFTLVHEPKPGRDNALNTGFNSVKYEFVCNVDDDTWVCPDYVKQAYSIMVDHPEVAVCGGRGIGEFEVTPPAWLKDFEQALAIGEQGKEEGYVGRDRMYLYGACAVYRKSLWGYLKKSGFQFFLSGRKGKKLNSGEDMELCMAWQLSGYKLWYAPSIYFKHFMPAGRLEWKYFRKLFKAFGRSDLISNQYSLFAGKYSGVRKKLFNSYFGYMIHTGYTVLKHLLPYLAAISFNNEGNIKVLRFERYAALFWHTLQNKKKFDDVRKSIQSGGWAKLNALTDTGK